MRLEDIIAGRRLLLFLGPGGVGKTTTSVLVALAAAKLGRKVALLSIDPARRLASALGIAVGNDFHDITLPDGYRGSLKASMIDQKSVFDDAVERFVPGEDVRQAIFGHGLYIQLSKNLGGPIEYLAMVKLQQILEKDDADLVIVDTPPYGHAMDFLDKPNILAGFVDKGVMKWLIKPFWIAQKLGAGKFISMGERLMGGMAAVTGVTALRTMAEFLVLIEKLILGFHDTGQKILTNLQKASTGFIVVASPSDAGRTATGEVIDEIERKSYSCSGIILNKTLPQNIRNELSSLESEPPAWLAGLVRRWQAERLAERELEQKASVLTSPEWDGVLGDLSQIDRFITSAFQI